jgi:hypothetical protein
MYICSYSCIIGFKYCTYSWIYEFVSLMIISPAFFALGSSGFFLQSRAGLEQGDPLYQLIYISFPSLFSVMGVAGFFL